MATLNIRLAAERGGESCLGVSTRLTRVAAVDGTRADRTVSTDVAVSAGAEVADAFEVQPGRYVVQAFLPSGDTLADVCVVPAEGAATLVLGPRGVPPVPRARGPEAPAGGARDFAYPSAGGMLDGTGGDAGAALTRFRPGRRANRSAGAGARREGAPTAASTFRVTRYAEPAALPDVALTRVPGAGDRPTYGVTAAPGYGPGRSAWIESARDGVAYRAALPSPWVAALAPAGGAGPDAVAVSFPEDGPPRVTVHDRAAGAMLAYLSGARIAQADLALRDLERRGLAPVEPRGDDGGGRAFPRLGACYVGVLGRSDPERWARSVRALRRLYPSSADAVTLLGRLRLETARTEADLDEARSLFVAAVRLDPPAFTAGVQMLLDGLAVFADEDAEAAAGRRAFLPVAAAVDTTQPFTVLGFRTGAP